MAAGTPQAEVKRSFSPPRLYPWREVVIFACIFMELTWSVLWYRLLFLSGFVITYWQAFFILGSMLIFFYLIARFMNHLEMSVGSRRMILGGLLLANLFLSLTLLVYRDQSLSLQELILSSIQSFRNRTTLLPPEFIVLILVLLVSWRGISFLGMKTGPADVMRRFQLGIVMFFTYGVFLPASSAAPMMPLYWFLFSSLMAMSAARITALLEVRGGQRIHFDFQWLFGIALFILAIIGLAALAVGLIRESLFMVFTNILAWLVIIVVILMRPFIWLFMRVIFGLMQLLNIDALVELLSNIVLRFRNLINSFLSFVRQWMGRLRTEQIAEWWDNLGNLKPYFLWGSILVVVVIILMTVRHYLVKRDEVDEQEIEALLNQEDLFSLLRSALRRSWGKIAESLERMMHLDHAKRLLAAARIRRIYAQLMQLSAKLECPRPPSKTPLEFLPELERIFPDQRNELQVITGAYLLVRYGELPDTSADVDKVEVAWKQVSEMGKIQLQAHKRIATN